MCNIGQFPQFCMNVGAMLFDFRGDSLIYSGSVNDEQ